MRINLDEIRDISSELVAALDGAGIDSNATLEVRMGSEMRLNRVRNGALDAVYFTFGPSEQGSTALVVDYVCHGIGIPIELRVNKEFDYTQVIVKCDGQIEGYSPFGFDPFKNVVQTKRFRPADFALAKEELRRLAS